MASQKADDPLELLSLFASGTLSINVDGHPLLKVDAESKSVDVDGPRVKECGIPLSKIIQLEAGRKGIIGLLSGSRATASRLSKKGWRLTLYDNGSELVRIGKGTSRLTGHMSMKPTRVRKILKSL
ncbi:MAG: hypothetical protein JRN15_00105 [Nitrososphaerota archaeon]|jgi:hypothetical protein|nr:hypothetical protein [Nitrososphaerota archaeon]